jgi:hypothetical protein
MRRTWLWTLALLIGVLAVPALAEPQDKPKPDTPKSPAEQYKALVEELSAAQREFSKLYQAAKTDEERQKLINEKYQRPDKYVPRFMEIAEKHPTDPAAVDALVWIATNSPYGDAGTKAIALLAKDHIQNEKMGQVVQRLAYMDTADAEKLLRSVLEKNPNRAAQAQAAYSLAQYLKNRAEYRLKDKAAIEKTSKEAEQLFEQVAEKYGDIKHYRGSLADAAQRDLFEIRNLGIGKVAPEIEGEDIDGQKFKLTDYRGKVVVIDFWGHW